MPHHWIRVSTGTPVPLRGRKTFRVDLLTADEKIELEEEGQEYDPGPPGEAT